MRILAGAALAAVTATAALVSAKVRRTPIIVDCCCDRCGQQSEKWIDVLWQVGHFTPSNASIRVIETLDSDVVATVCPSCGIDIQRRIYVAVHGIVEAGEPSDD